ncbi:HAD-IC family P-type ATPase [Halorhabdus sp. BNX81]|uniref:cation-translocating P-type ATPase n=1 Tax=Halorhabdus sp. BNX81 TaxID=2980181 RepID=UPI0023DCF0EF|nr:HAD-IC family P-type ATPase [Halorhabdus sp. BNX81]WEL21440.1 Cation-transporting P-type ATPase [Halorhabdus sp. BNX81]
MTDAQTDEDHPWTQSVDDILTYHDVSTDDGLSGGEVEHRRDQYGRNELRKTDRKPWWKILVEQFTGFIIILLGIAAIGALAIGETIEGISVVAVLVINGLVGFVTEMRARNSMESLQEMTQIETRVRRDGEDQEIPAEELVPGDVVILEAGDIVPADLRVIEPSRLQADESALTGESVPVGKTSEPLDADVPLAERSNMLYKGTYVTRGSVEAVVVSTGMDTELGKISQSLQEAAEEKTPLQEKLDSLGHKLVPFLLVVATIVLIAGWIRGQDLLLMVEEAIALAIATVPEGLPIVATLVLARGMWRMAERNALISDLASVETLGSTNIIATDKTGTLTENEMTVSRFELASGSVEVTGTGLDTEGSFRRGDPDVDGTDSPESDATLQLDEPQNHPLREALEVGVLCNNASVTGTDEGVETTGDPMEAALLIAGLKAGIDRESLLDSLPEAREVSFDPSVKMMATYHAKGDPSVATYHEEDGHYRVAVKGAPESVVESATRKVTDEGVADLSPEETDEWIAKADRMAADGLRVLALARKTVTDTEDDPYGDLELIGLVGMIDPPREEIKSTIQGCKDAGMRVVMVTGDHAGTAKNIARSVGIVDSDDAEVVEGSELDDPESLSDAEKERFEDASIFARVNPENKLDLIDLHQRAGSIVAMTGDGVNDSPALQKADIGVAMGKRGTQVAQEAADMILSDDNFESIYHAVREGRIIFGNIRKFVLYLMSCNLSELTTILLATLLAFPLPLLPLQILFLNVVTDIFPAFALGACEGGEDIMQRPPRDPDEPIMTRTNWTELGLYGLFISVSVVGAFAIAGGIYAGGLGSEAAVTVSFLTLAFAQLWHVFNMRELTSGILRNEVTENRYVWGALALSTLILIGATYLPGISLALSTAPIGLEGWAVVLGMSLLPLLGGQIERELRRHFGTPKLGTKLHALIFD